MRGTMFRRGDLYKSIKENDERNFIIFCYCVDETCVFYSSKIQKIRMCGSSVFNRNYKWLA